MRGGEVGTRSGREGEPGVGGGAESRPALSF